MADIGSLCVFCGSSPGVDPGYMELADSLGQRIAGKGWTLIYGGGKAGLMGAVAEGALRCGGRVRGIIPEAISAKVPAQEGIELSVCSTMHQRKQKMFDLSDGFLALPGGIGTIEEICEMWTWNQLGYSNKPVAFLDAFGFYQPLMAFFRHQVQTGFMKAFHLDQVIVEKDIESILRRLEDYQFEYVDKWQKK